MRGFDPKMFDEEEDDLTPTDPLAQGMAVQDMAQSVGLAEHLKPVEPKEMQLESTDYGVESSEQEPMSEEQTEAIQLALKDQMVQYKQKLKADQEKARLGKDMHKLQQSSTGAPDA